MKLNWNWSQYKAAGRHVASVVAGAVGMAVTMHFITPQQAVDVNGNLKDLFSGLQQVATAIAGLVAVLTPIYTAWRAAHTASPIEQAKSLVKEIPGTVVVTAPEIAAAVPSSAVVSNTEVKVTK